jgi:hypothetical protein
MTMRWKLTIGGSINDHAVEVDHRGIQRQLEDYSHNGSPNGGEE